jgi:two-component system CheB/CheR fusion protein
VTSENADPELEALLEHIKESRGFDFTGYKRASLTRRIRRRMQDVGIDGFGDYTSHLEAEPEEFTALFDTILINVTSFFRDPPAWDFLRETVVRAFVERQPVDGPIRVWSAGCSSGQEAYTISMVLADALGEQAFRERVKIYATDVDERALGQARHGMFTAKEVESIPGHLRTRYFLPREDGHVFRPDLRRTVIFGRHDLVQDPPISKVDLLIARNTLMYLNLEAQNRILESFRFALNDDGYLFLGKSELLLSRGKLFRPVQLRQRVFVKVASRHPGADAAVTARPDRPAGLDRTGADIGDVAYDAASPAQIMVSEARVLILANREARAFFGLGDSDLGRPIQDLELSYRPVELRSRIDQALSEKREIVVPDVAWTSPTGTDLILDVRVLPVLTLGGELRGVNIAFLDVTRHWRMTQELSQARKELETAYDELHSTVEELETTNEELQSTNEELETTNEELQSTNEELETMNEELQSTNEEMEATNDELVERSTELGESNFYFQSALASMRTAVVVVNADLRVQTWNLPAEDLWGLRSDEVVGQHFLDLDIGLPVDRRRPLIRSCLAGEADGDELTLDATNRRGKTISCRVICTPLRASAAEIRGAILLMEAI